MSISTRSAPQPAAVSRDGSDLIIDATDVVKTYHSSDDVTVQALRGVSLKVPRGEMVAIMGPSGCGKTTLLNCLSGLDTIDGGVILINGQDINRMSDNKRTEFRAKQMGFVFQFYNLLPVLSAVENVELPLLVSGTKAAVARAKAVEALDLVHLREWARHKPAQLSGGQRQRVTIARALVNTPAIVWGDEPTGDLDTQNASEIMDLISDLNGRQGQTFVIVTHAPEVAARCHRIVRMQDGRIISEEATAAGK
ncbi:MAG TPA: ABC transporter ATP-binding protein [Dehalococcoidia bacterium]|nr:ABC transporter ATP-binding protein [Dehalococcoidia bacterium]